MADIFVSYTSKDQEWAFWIGHELDALGHTPHLHDWEVDGGGDIMAWMEERHEAADHVVCVVSALYFNAAFSNLERRTAQWASVLGRANFVKPIFIEPCEAPSLFATLKRLDVHDLTEVEVRQRLKKFIDPARKPPRGQFPGFASTDGRVPFPSVARAQQLGEVLPFVGVPNRIALFTGRLQELSAIGAALASKSARRVAVKAMAGVGKTSLAVEYAHRCRRQYAGVWWCPAETRDGLLNSLAALAVCLGAAPSESINIEGAARNALDLLAQQQEVWLIVYDNVSSPAAISEFLPSSGADLIITSRFFDWLAWAVEISVDTLPIDDAISFLNNRTERSDTEGAQKLAETLGNLPLALDHAAALCRRTQMSFDHYALNAEKLIALAPSDSPYPLSVLATFTIAMEAASAKCKEANALMAYLSQCAPERIPMMLVDEVVSGPLQHDAIASLAEVSLIKHDPFDDGQPAITVHRLIQSIARFRSDAAGNTRLAIRRLIRHLYKALPGDGYLHSSSWPRWRQLVPHILFQHAAGFAPALRPVKWSAILNATASYLQGRSSLADAELLFIAALEIRLTTLGTQCELTANSFANLGNLLEERGDRAKAKAYMEQALAIRERLLRSNIPEIATTLTNLAVMIQDEGDLIAAQPLFARALKMRESTCGPQHSDAARALRNLGLLHLRLGEVTAARPLIVRAVSIWEDEHGLEDIRTALGYQALSRLLQKEKNFLEALPFLERALAIWERARPEHSVTINLRAARAELLVEIRNSSDQS